jgi:O-antigen/teichoic acid export membrane protein
MRVLRPGVLLRGAGARHVRAAAWLGSRQLAAAVVPLATVPVVVAHVPPADYGRFVVMLTVVMWASYLTAPVSGEAAAAAVARGQDGTFVYVLLRRLRLSVALAPLFAVASWVLVRGYDPLIGWLLAVGGGYVAVGFVFQMYRHYLVARRAFNLLAPWDVAVTVAPPLAMAAAAVMTGDILAVALASFVVQTVVAVAATVWVIAHWRLLQAYRAGRVDRAAHAFGIRFVPVTLAVSGFEEASTFITMALVGFEGVAVFGVAARLFDRLARMVMELARDLLRAAFATGDELEVAGRIRHGLGWLVASVVGLGAGLAVLGIVYLWAAMPGTYRLAVLYYAILACSFPARVLWEVFGLLPQVNLRFRTSTAIHLVAAGTEIVTAAAGAYLAGVTGLCVAVAASRWFGAGLAYVLAVERPLRAARAPARG